MSLKFVYLDHAATTSLRPEVREAMLPYFDEKFGNPSSTHRWGRQARNALEQARERLAAAIGAHRREVVFTGGGTEADNIAVLGRWRSACRSTGGNGSSPSAARGAVVCSAVEHKAVGAAAQCAADEGAELITLGVDEDGRVDLNSVMEALHARPCVVSVMWANNEVGTIEPVAEIGARCREADIVFHTDAVQAFAKLRVRVDETPCDLLSLSAHKISGPKGIGALYIREGTQVLPLVHGGGQERELRPGTENVASAVGFAVAAELAAAEQEEEAARLGALRARLREGLQQIVPELVVNGPAEHVLPNILNVTVPGADQEGVIIGLDLEGIAASGASACQSGTIKPSHVLAAMGRISDGDAAVRLSLGRTTTAEEIEFAISAFGRVIEQLRVEA
ncbi:MAG TPA: cysteine desulfurase family protein [Longimicrobiales bacterium]|nr:cysteine desulfurase family protein [Longimicrobiales bacterium]